MTKFSLDFPSAWQWVLPFKQKTRKPSARKNTQKNKNQQNTSAKSYQQHMANNNKQEKQPNNWYQKNPTYNKYQLLGIKVNKHQHTANIDTIDTLHFLMEHQQCTAYHYIYQTPTLQIATNDKNQALETPNTTRRRAPPPPAARTSSCTRLKIIITFKSSNFSHVIITTWDQKRIGVIRLIEKIMHQISDNNIPSPRAQKESFANPATMPHGSKPLNHHPKSSADEEPLRISFDFTFGQRSQD